MRSRLVLVFLPFFLLSACGDGFLSTTAGDFGVAFHDDEDCVEVDVSNVEIAAPFTIDLFLKSAEEAEYALYPLMIWPGAFALFQDRNEYTIFGPSSDTNPSAGASTPSSFVDGGYHHVAGTFDEDGLASLYLDGELKVTAPIGLLEDPGAVLYLGCWPGQDDATLDGVLGEVRIQGTQHYYGDFAPTWVEYEPADNVLALWHLNEGRGTAVLDAMGLSDGELAGGEWVDFPLPGYDPDEEDPGDTAID